MAIEIVQGGAYRLGGNGAGGVRNRTQQQDASATANTSPGTSRASQPQILREIADARRAQPAERSAENLPPPVLPEKTLPDQSTRSVLTRRTAEGAGALQRAARPANAPAASNPRTEVERADRLANSNIELNNAETQRGNQTAEAQIANTFANRDIQLGGRVNLTA